MQKKRIVEVANQVISLKWINTDEYSTVLNLYQLFQCRVYTKHAKALILQNKS